MCDAKSRQRLGLRVTGVCSAHVSTTREMDDERHTTSAQSRQLDNPHRRYQVEDYFSSQALHSQRPPNTNSAEVPGPTISDSIRGSESRHRHYQVDDYTLSPARRPWYPLDSDLAEIRLLTVLPGRKDEPVVCKLWQISLRQDEPRYETISYAWGDATVRGELTVDGQSVSVAASAEAALRAVRLTSEARVIWLDAVCINQQDKSERAQQVAMMRDIYASSQGNLIHLGENDTADIAVKSMCNMLDEFHDRTGSEELIAKTVFEPPSIWKASTVRPSAPFDEQALSTLLSQPWFRRLWVVQEVFAAPENTCLYGKTQFLLTHLLRMCIWISFNRTFLYSLASLDGAVHGAALWARMDGPHKILPGQGFAIEDALAFTRDLEASELRDKVFAILGILRQTSKGILMPTQLVPDYRKPVAEVFRDLLKVAIFDENSLDTVLRRVHHLSEPVAPVDGWPSWLPLIYLWGWQADEPGTLRDFSASGVPRKALLLHSPPKILRLRGFCLGHVSERTIGFMFSDCGLSTIQYWIVEALILAQFSRSTKGPKAFSSLAHLLLAGNDVTPPHLLNSSSDGLEGLIMHVFQKQKLPDPLRSVYTNPFSHESEQVASHFFTGFWQACGNRRLFIMQDGRCCLGPTAMKPGDVVAILSGCCHPYVLRKVESHFLVIGHCYVEGVMLGEALPQREGPRGMDEIFDLW